jgi:hypothetical protein
MDGSFAKTLFYFTCILSQLSGLVLVAFAILGAISGLSDDF